jgi:hypothetical protein
MDYQYMTPQKAKIVAVYYLKNGNKRAAMLEAGFPADYVGTSKCYAMFRGSKVQDAIRELEVEAKVECGALTVSQVIEGFRRMAFPPPGTQVSNADKNYAMDKLGKLSGGYAEKLLIGRGTDEQPTPVSAEDVDMFREMARAAIRNRLNTAAIEAHGPVVGPSSIREEVEAELCSKFPNERNRQALFAKFSEHINTEVLRRERA